MDVQPGDRFEDLDPRAGNRVIRITEVDNDRCAYEVEVSDLNPDTVGRHGHVTIATLTEYYRKVSH